MTNELTYREATVSDIEAIKQVTQAAYSQFYNILSAENVNAWQAMLGADKTYYDLFKIAYGVVCEENNSIIGSAFLVASGNPYQWFEKEWAYIRLVAVQPNKEGNGIGKMLTQLCIEKAKQNGEKIVALHTSAFQNSARHIYETIGFEKLKDIGMLFGKLYYLYTLHLT